LTATSESRLDAAQLQHERSMTTHSLELAHAVTSFVACPSQAARQASSVSKLLLVAPQPP
jgi:hypothetical protein